MKFDNVIIKAYILRSMEELIRSSFEFHRFDDSLEKMYTYVDIDKGCISIEFYGREKRWDDESKWVNYFTRQIGCTEILNWMMEKDKQFKYVMTDLSRFAHVIWDEYRKKRDEYYSDKE